jgi:predicted ATP-grasp superfamily ATP-dependent carboligase
MRASSFKKSLRSDRPPVVLLGDLSLVWALAMGEVPIILATEKPADISIRSRHVNQHVLLSPFGDPACDRAVAELQALGRSIHKEIGCKVPLFYSSDKHLELIYQNRRPLREHYSLLLNDEDLSWALHDKLRFYEVAEHLQIPVPRTLHGRHLAERLSELREPLLVKPRSKASWKDIQASLFDGRGKAIVFNTASELTSHPGFIRHLNEVIVQEFVPGEIEQLPSFHGFADAEGRMLASYCGRKIRTFPRFAGESCLIELAIDAEIDAAGRAIVDKLGLRGPFKIDFIRDKRTGQFLTLEVNARFNLWNHLGAVEGVNLPLIAYEYLMFGKVPSREPVYKPRHRWVNLYSDYCAYRERRDRGELSLLEWLRSTSSPSMIYDSFSWSDPAPFMQWAGGLLRNKLDLAARSAARY